MAEIQRGTHVPPGEGESVWLVGDLIEVKLASEDTGGAYSMVEETSPPEGGPPPHIHHNVDEALYVVEGEVEVLVGDRTTRAIAGALAYVPKGTLHTFKNVGTSPSRVVAIISPGGFEKFFVEAGDPATEGSSSPEGEPDVGRIVEIGQKYGLEIPPPPGQ
jgi:mannose-6-phosphate isomerase-like protein (cupin superfamily)